MLEPLSETIRQILLELTLCIGSWVAFGRLNHVFGLDTSCVLPKH